MLIGAHVSPAGGPANAVARGEERGATAIQIFNQNPRAWKPTFYSDEQIEAYHEAMIGSPVKALLIHAVYLLNAASDDPEIREKTLTSLAASLQAGDRLGAHAVVLHPGSAKTGEVGPAIARAGEVIAEALALSESCPLHLENTAGAGRHPRAFVRRARPADRSRRRQRAPGRLPGQLPPVRLGLRHPHDRRSHRDDRRLRGDGRGRGVSARCTSTIPRRRWARTATGTRTSVTVSSVMTAARRSCPSRASSRSPSCSRRPARTGPARRPRSSRSAASCASGDWPRAPEPGASLRS